MAEGNKYPRGADEAAAPAREQQAGPQPAGEPPTGEPQAGEQAARETAGSGQAAERAAGAEPAADEAEALNAQQELQKIEAELRDANQRALRSQAELENFRKRIRREMEEEQRYAAVPLMRDLLSVADNLQRALEAAENHEGGSGLLQGVKMVAQQLDSVLQQHECREIEALGQPFDPHLHEAVGQEPSDQYPPGTVTRIIRTGYRVHDRVVRPTQVFIAANASGPREASEETGTSSEASGGEDAAQA